MNPIELAQKAEADLAEIAKTRRPTAEESNAATEAYAAAARYAAEHHDRGVFTTATPDGSALFVTAKKMLISTTDDLKASSSSAPCPKCRRIMALVLVDLETAKWEHLGCAPEVTS